MLHRTRGPKSIGNPIRDAVTLGDVDSISGDEDRCNHNVTVLFALSRKEYVGIPNVVDFDPGGSIRAIPIRDRWLVIANCVELAVSGAYEDPCLPAVSARAAGGDSSCGATRLKVSKHQPGRGGENRDRETDAQNQLNRIERIGIHPGYPHQTENGYSMMPCTSARSKQTSHPFISPAPHPREGASSGAKPRRRAAVDGGAKAHLLAGPDCSQALPRVVRGDRPPGACRAMGTL